MKPEELLARMEEERNQAAATPPAGLQGQEPLEPGQSLLSAREDLLTLMKSFKLMMEDRISEWDMNDIVVKMAKKHGLEL